MDKTICRDYWRQIKTKDPAVQERTELEAYGGLVLNNGLTSETDQQEDIVEYQGWVQMDWNQKGGTVE